MPATETEIARRENGRVIVRPGAVRVSWEMADLATSDGYAVRAVFSGLIQPVEDSAERRLLEESFLSRATVMTVPDVAAFFRPSLESVARRTVSATDAAALLTDATRSSLQKNLADAARAVAFGCGLQVAPPLELELDSPTLRVKQEEQRRSAIQTERLTRAAAMVKQFQEFRAAAPELPAGQILKRLATADPTEQAETLRALLLAGAQESAGKKLWAVAGPHLLQIQSNGLEGGQPPTTEIFAPPAALGPFRSVQQATINGKTTLLIGARCGVLAIDPADPSNATIYADPETKSDYGFNSAAVADGKIWATHFQSGLVAWNLGEGEKPALAVRPSTVSSGPISPRNLTALDDARLIFGSESRLLEINSTGAIREAGESLPTPVVAIIVPDRGHICVVHEDGELCRRDRSDLKLTGRCRRAGKVVAASPLPWLGSLRLLLAGDDGSVFCIGLDDELMMQYFNPYSGMRIAAAAAAADRIAAVSADRQRILLWPSWDGRKPASEIHVPSLARHRVADVEFA